eukprot:5845970-Prymnesium_polylepis.1
MADLYVILHVARDASDDSIRAAYKERARLVHPDKTGGDKAEFQRALAAYEVLRDPVRRAVYDQSLADRTRRPRYDREIDSPPTSPSERKPAAQWGASSALPVTCVAVVSGEVGDVGGATVRHVFPPEAATRMSPLGRAELAEAALPWERDAAARATGSI